MKRQLADRARQAEALEKQLQLEKQELEFLRGGHDQESNVANVVTNAKEFQIDRKSRTIQFPSSTDPIQSTADITGVSSIVGNHAPTTPVAGTTAGSNQNVEGTATSVSSATTSSTSSGAIKRDTPSFIQDAVGNELHPSSPSISKDELQLQRPTKVPRLNDNQSRNNGSPLNHNIHQTEQKAGLTSSSSTNVAAITAANSVGPLQAQSSSRRLSLDPQQLASSNEAMVNSHANHDDNASSQQSAFYLKHQNRALATELKSYQYSISELLQERTIRRSHCYRIFQNVQQLINIWNTIENTLVSTSETNLGRERVANPADTDANMKDNNESVPLGIDDAVASTGSDDSVEWTRALHKALKALGRCSQNENGGSVVDESASPSMPSGNNDNSNEYHYTEEIVANISARAKTLQDWLQNILEKQRPNDNDVVMDEKSDHDESSVVQQQRQEISELLTRCATLESQITELVTCRSDLIQRERRLRRNIYRMASNLLSPEQVVNSAITRPEEVTYDYNNEYDDIETSVQLEKQELLRLQKEHQELINATKSLQTSRTSDQGDSVVADGTNTYSETPQISHLLSKQIDEYQIKVAQLEESVAISNESIHQLNDILKEKEIELTLLSQRQVSDDDRVTLESIPSTLLQLSHSQQRNIELQKRLSTTEEMWAESLSNEKAAMQSVSDLVQKFNKRWAELTSTAFTEHHDSPSDAVISTIESAVLSTSTDDVIHEHPHIRMSKQIHELQFKLQQAMENVRQADLSRENLKTALAMNATLQSKLDDLKVKYTALQSARTTGTSIKGSASTKNTSTTDNDGKNGVSTNIEDVLLPEASNDDNVNGSNTDAVSTSTSRKEKPDPSKSQNADSNTTGSSTNRTSTSASSSEKMHREYRKVRKELAAMTTNHAAMMTTNVRLVKQITEKDEMNAKSLSTILHLKSTTEKIVEERDHLETQMKNASQLALAARLATNAKDRVSEELLKEKNSLDLRRIALEEQLLTTETELNRISIEWANASSSISSKDTELTNVRQRCNQLVEENERYREEARNLKNALRQAEREIRDKNERLAEIVAQASKDGNLNGISSDAVSSSSSFTVEQLQTQVSVLKNRLACPVCHYRDKECIIIRCRHMHCKQCVDERVSNRSRKCPTCNVKFAENEVETIFLS